MLINITPQLLEQLTPTAYQWTIERLIHHGGNRYYPKAEAVAILANDPLLSDELLAGILDSASKIVSASNGVCMRRATGKCDQEIFCARRERRNCLEAATTVESLYTAAKDLRDARLRESKLQD